MAFTQRYLRMMCAGESANIFVYTGVDPFGTVANGGTYFSSAYADLRVGDVIIDFCPAATSWGVLVVTGSSTGGVNTTVCGTSSNG